MKNQEPKTTPWGVPQVRKQIAPGIILFETASHGGFWLSPDRNQKISKEQKLATFCQNGIAGWYEEDCDAEIVRTTFAEFFKK
jgi:hypothetical protein